MLLIFKVVILNIKNSDDDLVEAIKKYPLGMSQVYVIDFNMEYRGCNEVKKKRYLHWTIGFI